MTERSSISPSAPPFVINATSLSSTDRGLSDALKLGQMPCVEPEVASETTGERRSWKSVSDLASAPGASIGLDLGSCPGVAGR